MGHNALDDGIKQLYHYQPFDPEHLTDILVNKRVHCSDPSNLNDPWDCRPSFDSNLLNDPLVLEEWIKWLFSLGSVEALSLSEVESAQAQLRSDPRFRQEAIERFCSGFLGSVPRYWHIYCLTPVPNSTLMWSHYASNHRGICLEFDVVNQVFSLALPVRYHSTCPKWMPHQVAQGEAAELLLTKSEDWSYEREYRIVGKSAQSGFGKEDYPLKIEGKFMGIPAGALQAVLVGCEGDFKEVSDLVQKYDRAVKVKRVVRSLTEYRLEVAG